MVGGDIAGGVIGFESRECTLFKFKVNMAMGTTNFKLLQTFTTIISEETSTSLIL